MRRRTTNLRRMRARSLPSGGGWTPSHHTRRARPGRARARLPGGGRRLRRPGAAARPPEAVRARVSEALLPALRGGALAELARRRADAALAVVVDDDDAARTLAEVGGGVPAPAARPLHARPAAPSTAMGSTRRRTWSASASGRCATLEEGGLVAVSVDALIERLTAPADRPQPVRLRPDEEVDRSTTLQRPRRRRLRARRRGGGARPVLGPRRTGRRLRDDRPGAGADRVLRRPAWSGCPRSRCSPSARCAISTRC